MSENKKEIPQLTDEELDNVADTAIEFLQKIISYYNVGEITINEYEGAEKELILDINGDDLAILIGQHGKTLDALQQIISILSYKKLGFYYPIIIDIEGYKSRQRIKLENMAKNIAKKAVKQQKAYSFYPMNPYKRRIIHTILAKDDKVETHSEGEGRNRHIVVTPVE
ncbi:MAG: R3H domain-containing nucleic acid-binding protein [Coriobacteriia bacterium]|nr:R3H domain-containing nucleic acid-binding protein [Coriobacteriia bacterium]